MQTTIDSPSQQLGSFLTNKTTALLTALVLLAASGALTAATTGAEFQIAYDFIYNAATGYLGRGIAIVGGLIGLGVGAATGKAIPAIIGIVLGIFGALGPDIVNAIFGSALI